MSSESVTHTTDAGFAVDVLQSATPVLVDWWAPWCAPCRAIAPVLEEIAKDWQGRLRVVKVNVDEHRQTPAQYGLRSIPTLMLFRGGELLGTRVGALNKGDLLAWLEQELGAAA